MLRPLRICLIKGNTVYIEAKKFKIYVCIENLAAATAAGGFVLCSNLIYLHMGMQS